MDAVKELINMVHFNKCELKKGQFHANAPILAEIGLRLTVAWAPETSVLIAIIIIMTIKI